MGKQRKSRNVESQICSHPIHDQVELINQVEIKDFETRIRTIMYSYRCRLHPGKCGNYTVEMAF